MKTYKIHYFVAKNNNASACSVRPSTDNWDRKDYCTPYKQKVTCKHCQKKIKCFVQEII